MKLTKSELKEMIREALREELVRGQLEEGIFSEKVPEGTVVNIKYFGFEKRLNVFIQPTKGIHKNTKKPLKYVFYDIPFDLYRKMDDGATQEVFDTELRSGKYKFKKEDYYTDDEWKKFIRGTHL